MRLPLAFRRSVTGRQARDRLCSRSSNVGGGSAAGSSAISFDDGRRATGYMDSSMPRAESPRSFRVCRPGPTCTSVGLPVSIGCGLLAPVECGAGSVSYLRNGSRICARYVLATEPSDTP